jgi:hypothetical protein
VKIIFQILTYFSIVIGVFFGILLKDIKILGIGIIFGVLFGVLDLASDKRKKQN